jgi:hypothetical protein
MSRVAELPSNHSPLFAPVIEPTLTTGVGALVAAAHTWLHADDPAVARTAGRAG